MNIEKARTVVKLCEEIDAYESKLQTLKNCDYVNATIIIGPNGKPIKYARNSLEVQAIMNAYKNHITVLKYKIERM